MDKLLRIRDVQNATGLGRSAIYAKIARGHFPAPVMIGERAVAWPASKVQDWIEQRPAKGQSRVPPPSSPDAQPRLRSRLHPGAHGAGWCPKTQAEQGGGATAADSQNT